MSTVSEPPTDGVQTSSQMEPPPVVRRAHRPSLRRQRSARLRDTIEITMVALAEDVPSTGDTSREQTMDRESEVARTNWLRLRRRWRGYRRLARLPTTDEIDGVSITAPKVYQFQVPRDAQFYFQHPYVRLFVVILVTALNFLVYAEDPTSHSRLPCRIPVIGHCYTLAFPPYPPVAWTLLRVALIVSAIIVAVVAGKILVHRLLFQRLLKLEMFSDDKGSWLVMLFTAILTLLGAAHLFNLVLMLAGSDEMRRRYHITSEMNMSDSFYAKLAMCGTWSGNFLTIWVVLDMMLQERMLYSDWCAGWRDWYTTGYNRIVIFWTVVISITAVGIASIVGELVSWDWLTGGHVYSDELTRALLASVILVCDLVVVMQDWDFPHFINSLEIKLPGFNFNDFVFELPHLLHPSKWYKIHLTGKWLNYGMVFIVMLLDVNMWNNQIFYNPSRYLQYRGPDGRIYTAGAMPTGELLPDDGMELAYAWRSRNYDPATNQTWSSGDTRMNSRFSEHPTALKFLAILPSVVGLTVFALLVWHFGRRPPPAPNDPGRGRLIRQTVRFSQQHRRSSVPLNNPWGLDLTPLMRKTTETHETQTEEDPESKLGNGAAEKDDGHPSRFAKIKSLLAVRPRMKSSERDQSQKSAHQNADNVNTGEDLQLVEETGEACAKVIDPSPESTGNSKLADADSPGHSTEVTSAHNPCSPRRGNVSPRKQVAFDVAGDTKIGHDDLHTSGLDEPDCDLPQKL